MSAHAAGELAAPAVKAPGPRSRARILQCALELLVERGYPGVSVEGIAERASVSKVTIYRWWPNKAAVVMDAFVAHNEPHVRFRDTGSTQADFLDQMRRAQRFMKSPTGHLIRTILAEAQHDSDFAAAFRANFWDVRRAEAREALQRGIDRGEVRADLDQVLILDALYGAFYLRLLIGHAPLDDAFLESLVTAVFEGVGTAAGRGR